jgi:MFS family permease
MLESGICYVRYRMMIESPQRARRDDNFSPDGTQMITKLRSARNEYPNQFWLMAFGMLIGTMGSSMIWPFLMIYVSETLSVGLTVVASMMSLNAVMNLLFSFLAGPVTDRVGRKWVMVISLAGNGLCYVLMSFAGSVAAFAILMGLRGAFMPLYRVGSDAMMADMVLPEKRADGYAVLRMSNNLGIALGPAVGGFVASASYTIGFYIAAVALITYSLLLVFFAKETLQKDSSVIAVKERFGGYGQIFRDKPFINFNLIFTLTAVASSMIWVLLAVYTKQNYGIPEKLYGFIPATNAIMVVTLQILITRFTKRRPAVPMVALGASFYVLANLIIGVGFSFWMFWAAMVVMTIGELIMVPTATTYVANLAPADKRGRYMSIHGMTNGISMGIGPLLGGFLSDSFSPHAPWFFAAGIGLISVLLYFVFIHHTAKTTTQSIIPAEG